MILPRRRTGGIGPARASSRGRPTLRAGEAHALAILDAALDAVVTIDLQGRVLEFNSAAERTFGYRRADILGLELAELIVPPAYREAHRHALTRWTDAGPGAGAGSLVGRRVEVQAMRSDGSQFPAELAIARVELPGPPAFTACIRDISDQRAAEERLKEAEFRYRTLVEHLPLITYIGATGDARARPTYISPQIESVLGVTPTDWLETPGVFEDRIHPDDRAWVLEAQQRAYDRREPLQLVYRMTAVDGRLVWVEDRSVHVEPEGGGAFRQGVAIDITERMLAEEAVRGAETRYRTLVEHLPLAVYVDRLDRESSNVYTSPQIEPMLGYTSAEWERDPQLFVDMLHPDDRERVLAAHAATHATGEPLQLDYRLVARDGRVVWVHDEARVIADPTGGPALLQGYLLDITARRDAEEQLRHQAFHDPLTGLANRALFTDRVEHALERLPAGGDVAVVFLDLDDFKAVNDTLGHLAGDALLAAVGGRLRERLAPTHTVARLGGDEFAVLLEDVPPETATREAQRLMDALADSFLIEGREMFVTASVGIAVGDDADRLMRSADVAMYRAKAAGKAQYAFYAPRMEDEVIGRLELIADLRRARLDEEMRLLYQPTVDLIRGDIVGAEALLRWQHPEQGLLAPALFIPLAEETGRIVEIGAWVLAEACLRAAQWHAGLAGGSRLSVSVNVSPRQVQPHLVEVVRHALERSGLEPALLTLEITESVLAHRREDVAAVLADVTDLGVRLALDDFGTGYSSLSLLRDLPVHVLKIDQSFVRDLEHGPDSGPFLQAIVDLASALSLEVVAEGIQSVSQVVALRRLGCRLGQGFHFSAPCEPDALERFVRSGLPRAKLGLRAA
jgi:diguanylate cyclase (GGDEF)-like protein/PAS domain S-box-containing protein